MPQSREEPRLKIAEEDDSHDWCPNLDRRAALRLLSMSTLAALSGCGGSTTTATTDTATTGTTASTTKLTASSTTAEQSASLTLSAAVTPTAATGTVTFYDSTTSLGTATLSSGTAALATSFSTTGSHTLTAAYGGDTTYAASTSAAVTITVAAASSCAETLEGEEGPYFVDDSASGYLRSNILSNLDGSNTQTGVPFTLTIYVFDSEKSCAPMQGVQVDIWHCNAAGIYSAESVESTVGESWLRGYGISDATGKVQFTTVIPGWYQGRTTHIHLRFRSTYDDTDNSGTNTMQVFFDQTLIDTLSTSVAPYSAEGQNPTTNASDHVYADQEQATTLLTLTGSNTAGYTATFNAHMPIVTA
jgi:protocatechuate 3,4-dioxygenase beta subunit